MVQVYDFSTMHIRETDSLKAHGRGFREANTPTSPSSTSRASIQHHYDDISFCSNRSGIPSDFPITPAAAAPHNRDVPLEEHPCSNRACSKHSRRQNALCPHCLEICSGIFTRDPLLHLCWNRHTWRVRVSMSVSELLWPASGSWSMCPMPGSPFPLVAQAVTVGRFKLAGKLRCRLPEGSYAVSWRFARAPTEEELEAANAAQQVWGIRHTPATCFKWDSVSVESRVTQRTGCSAAAATCGATGVRKGVSGRRQQQQQQQHHHHHQHIHNENQQQQQQQHQEPQWLPRQRSFRGLAQYRRKFGLERSVSIAPAAKEGPTAPSTVPAGQRCQLNPEGRALSLSSSERMRLQQQHHLLQQQQQQPGPAILEKTGEKHRRERGGSPMTLVSRDASGQDTSIASARKKTTASSAASVVERAAAAAARRRSTLELVKSEKPQVRGFNINMDTVQLLPSWTEITVATVELKEAGHDGLCELALDFELHSFSPVRKRGLFVDGVVISQVMDGSSAVPFDAIHRVIEESKPVMTSGLLD